ncbi:MAG: HAMP domain-containing histidine kinase [Bacteroidales bacterium]|jgi:nitrogen-specific signal transduction histidine kinase|nr:HAMP domain-containing histidine kinase [Bacteroidales bacterium]
MGGSLLTCFASAERASQDELIRQHKVIIKNHDLIVFLDGIVSMVTVLNVHRQVVFANKQTLAALALADVRQVLGQRLGEAFGCEHADEINGCGTSPHCSVCGAVRTQLNCKRNSESIDECSLTNATSKMTLDLRIHSTFTSISGEDFIICSVFDISSEKRRGVMERIFFHDILNTINGINGIAQVISKVNPDRQNLYLLHLKHMLQLLVEEIDSHRILTLAEKNDYVVTPHEIHSMAFLIEIIENLGKAAALERKDIRITSDSRDYVFVSDTILLSRVIINMVKNALEAEPEGAAIEIGIRKDDEGSIYFHVKNDSVMDRKVQLQIFNRSFSTKSKDRGIGTYSMKFLTEKYLNGSIDFISNQETGTVFAVKIPVFIEKTVHPDGDVPEAAVPVGAEAC